MAKRFLRLHVLLWLAIGCCFGDNLDDKLSISEQPFGQSIPLNQSVELGCVFSHPVDCLWLQDERDQSNLINGRIEYISNGGLDTKDCSIKFNKVERKDYGEWQCENYQGREYLITIKSRIIELRELSETVFRNVSEEVHALECKISTDMTGNITWQHRLSLSEVWKERSDSSGQRNLALNPDSKPGLYRCIISNKHRKIFGNIISVQNATEAKHETVIYAATTAVVIVVVIAVVAISVWCYMKNRRDHKKNRRDHKNNRRDYQEGQGIEMLEQNH